MHLPTLDVSRFAHGSEIQRKLFALELVQSFRTYGFACISGHGLDKQKVMNLFESSQSFFALPREERMKIVHHPGPNPQRGWCQMNQEQTSKIAIEKGYGTPAQNELELTDAKEHFDMGPPSDKQYPNKWPDLEGFQATMEEHFLTCQAVSLDLLRAIEIGLSLPQGCLVENCTGSASELRLNHYPAISLHKLRDGSTARIWPHTDFGVITLLFQDASGGLEIQDPDHHRQFKPVEANDRTHMIVNICDTLQRWTNDVLPAGVHQVTIPESLRDVKEGILRERYSCAFFLKADRTANVGALAPFVNVDQPSKYENITALEFQMKRNLVVY